MQWFELDRYRALVAHTFEKSGGALETRRRLGDHSIRRVTYLAEDPMFNDIDSCSESPPCGGCGSCMIAQAVYSGWEVVSGCVEVVKMRMLPGQAPYTQAALGRLNSLLASAARAEEIYSRDELEEFAKNERTENNGDPKTDSV